MSLILLFTVFMYFLQISSLPIEILPYNDPNTCNISEIFNVNLLKCQICDINKNLVPSSNKQNCECNERSKPIFDSSIKISTPRCETCRSDSIFSKYINNCIKCSNGLVKKNNITICKPCKDNEIMVQQFTNGTFLSQTKCIPCTNGMTPSNDRRRCVPCSILNPVVDNGALKCLCDYKSVLVGNICVPKLLFPQFSNIKSKYYLQYHTGETVESQLFDTQLKLNIYLCKLQNATACQILANLCTLALFSFYENSPCNLWLESRNSANIETDNLKYLPWLIYREGEANIVLNRKKIPVKYSLKPSLSISRLHIKAVVFNLDGSLKEVKSLLGSDLNLCPNLNHVKNVGLRFGVNYEYTCQIEAKQYFDGKNTEFIVPYLQYYENGKNTLYAVPVLIRNIVQYRNNLEDPTNWLLVRRFFMYDSISSISSKSDQPSIYRFVKSVQIKTILRDDGNGLIYPPLIILEYGEFTKENYHSQKINFKFSTLYEIKNTIQYPIEISIGTLSALVVLYSGIQTWSHSKRSGKIEIDSLTLLRIILFSCGNLANTFYFVAFSVSVYIFIFFKGQSVVHLLLPTSGQEKILKDFIITAFCLKIVEIVILIWNQINIDIFLIDWERPRPMDTIPRPRRSSSPFTLSSNTQQSVSIWRSYFIANEWNEIQTTRKINVLAHFVIITFVLKVLGIEYWGTPDPELHTSLPEYLQNNQMSFVCRFAIGSLVYVAAYSIQLLFMIGIYERYVKNTIQQFVDLCSLANISVFIMSLQRYGFYIHGRSSHGFADTDMSTMLKQLQREEEDLCAYRGLLPGTHNQTFSVGVPAKLRLYYNKLMNPARSSTFGMSISNLGLGDISPSRSFESNRSEFDKISHAYNNLNKFLSAFLEHALKDLDYDVKDKLFVESLLDIEFTDSIERGVLYPDNGHSFDSVLFYGNEFCLFTFDLMVFSFVLLLSDDFVLTILSTIFVTEVLKMVRSFGGKRNLAQKTLIDQRFLI